MYSNYSSNGNGNRNSEKKISSSKYRSCEISPILEKAANCKPWLPKIDKTGRYNYQPVMNREKSSKLSSTMYKRTTMVYLKKYKNIPTLEKIV